MSIARQKQTQNRSAFWNGRVASASSDRERAAVWHDACRTLAVQAEQDGRPEVWAALVNHLHDFYKHYSR